MRSKRRIAAGHTVARLVTNHMKHKMIDSLAEHLLADPLDSVGMTAQVKGGRIGFRIDPVFPVDMPGRTRGAALNVSELAMGPELAANLVGIRAVNGEIAGEAPVPVVFAPNRHAMLVSHIAKSGHIVLRNHIGDGASQIP